MSEVSTQSTNPQMSEQAQAAPMADAPMKAAAVPDGQTADGATAPQQEPNTPKSPTTPTTGAEGAKEGARSPQTGSDGGTKEDKPLSPSAYRAEVERAIREDAERRAAGITKPQADEPQAVENSTPAVEVPVVQTGDDDDLGETKPLPKDMRLPTKDDPLTFEAARIFKARKREGHPVSLGEAERLAKVVLGIDDVPPVAVIPAAPETPNATDGKSAAADPDALPETVAATADRIKALLVEKQALNQGFDFSRDIELEEQIDRLRDHRLLLKGQQEAARLSAEEQRQKEFLGQWNASMAQAVDMFPAAKDGASALSEKAAAIQAAMRERGDPLYSDPRSALLIYIEAARELGIAPSATKSSPSVPASKPAPAASATSHSAASLLASASAGKTSAPAQSPGIDLSRVSTPAEYRRLVASLGMS